MNESDDWDLLLDLLSELEKYLNDDDANKKLEFQPGELIETEERNPQLEENSANTSREYYSNENAATNSSGDAPSTLNIAVSQVDSNVEPNNEKTWNNIGQHGFVSDKVNSPLLISTERRYTQYEHNGRLFFRQLPEVLYSCIFNGKKPFTCDICKKPFNYKSSLVNHIRTHSGEKPFSCKLCPKVFSRKHNLKVHIITHTGEKPFKCNYCKKAYTRKQKLKEHAAVHTGEKPFKCELCDRFYATSGGLRYHQRTHKAQ